MFLRPLLLRPQDQKVHNDEDQNERQQLHPEAVAAERRRRLGKSGRHEHLCVLCAVGPRATAPPPRFRPAKSARTIAATGPIATLPGLDEPPGLAARNGELAGDLAGLPAPR